MRFKLGAWPVPGIAARGWLPLVTLAEIVLIGSIAWATTVLFWTLVRPFGPIGRWQAGTATGVVADPALLTRFDPFFRDAVAVGSTNVTSLPLKLFGTRLDQAMGRGSAIIATPEGLQSSFAVGEEIVPGVKLKSVAFDSVTIDRGGVSEQLFLDQSVAAPVASGTASSTGVPNVPAAAISPFHAQALAMGVAFAPRVEKGAITGFTVSPKGSGDAFTAAGLQAGDVVTQINGATIRSVDDAMQAMNNTTGGSQISISVERSGKSVMLRPGAAR
jgi:general secretion pathway protein C